MEPSKTSMWDVPIEFIKSLKELTIHLVDSETHTLAGKANLLVLFIFGVTLVLHILASFYGNVSIPFLLYLLLGLGMMSCIVSSTSLKNSKINSLRDTFQK